MLLSELLSMLKFSMGLMCLCLLLVLLNLVFFMALIGLDVLRSGGMYLVSMLSCVNPSFCGKSKKQNIVSRSSTEIEYKSISITVSKIVSLRGLLSELNIFYEGSPLLYYDNKVVIQIASYSIFHERTKYKEINHFVMKKSAWV